ncbi:ABC transporter permease [Microlunatus soli]|uniref:Peptide/nickel transport system permease protein n=1 Tax=Microlunatus soli TaxID=630515 RepID=A0A1H1VP25_9ACTN|nr:ABC transporter permease [Microlunatus soli]SDS86016.1 peptide/nickel transport system permease protein [Microlunatus soli]
MSTTTGAAAARAASTRRVLDYLRFLAGRFGGMLLVLLIIAVISYLIFYVLPSDPAQLSCGRPCTPDRLETARAFMGYDKPWWQQFGLFIGGIVAGRTFGSGPAAIHCSAPCFGYSFRLNEPVTQLITDRIPVTFSIAIGAAVLWLLLGVSTGVVSALRRGTLIDRSLMTISIAGVSAPSYLVGLLGIFIFGFILNMVPVSGYVPFSQSPVDWLWHLVLPWIVLALLNAAIYTRLTRGQMLEVMGEDYIRTARAKGLTERRVIGRHALRNVLIPVSTVFGLDLGGLLGGAVITEKVFSMQGLGSLLIDAVGNLDLQVLVGVTLFSAFLIIVANFVVDVTYGLLDPRVKVT